MTQPRIIDKFLHLNNGDGYPAVIKYSSRTMAPKAIFVHIQEGSNWGSYQWFHQVQASSTVLIGKNGDIWRLVPEDKAPWTNGDTRNPTAKGLALLNKYGWDANRYSLTIETEGFSGDGVPDAQMQSVVWQIRDWQKRYNIPNSMIFRHADVNTVTRPRCPGDAYFNRLMAVLNQGTSVPTTSVGYAKPHPPMVKDKLWDGLKDATINGTRFHADKRTITTLDGLNRRQWASTTSDLTGAAYRSGSKVQVLGWVNGEEVSGELRWWVATNGDRLWAGGTVEKPNAEKPKDKPDNSGSDNTPVVVNGINFFPVTKGKKFKLSAATNVRQWASTDSKIIKTLPAGTIIEPLYEVDGELVGDHGRWYVPDKSSINSGTRIWSGTAVPTED